MSNIFFYFIIFDNKNKTYSCHTSFWLPELWLNWLASLREHRFVHDIDDKHSLTHIQNAYCYKFVPKNFSLHLRSSMAMAMKLNCLHCKCSFCKLFQNRYARGGHIFFRLHVEYATLPRWLTNWPSETIVYHSLYSPTSQWWRPVRSSWSDGIWSHFDVSLQ